MFRADHVQDQTERNAENGVWTADPQRIELAAWVSRTLRHCSTKQEVPIMAAEGYVAPDGRLIYSVIYTIGQQMLIVPLDADGNSVNRLTRTADPTKRLVEVRPGEELQFRSKRYKVTSVETYRWVEGGVTHGWPDK